MLISDAADVIRPCALSLPGPSTAMVISAVGDDAPPPGVSLQRGAAPSATSSILGSEDKARKSTRVRLQPVRISFSNEVLLRRRANVGASDQLTREAVGADGAGDVLRLRGGAEAAKRDRESQLELPLFANSRRHRLCPSAAVQRPTSAGSAQEPRVAAAALAAGVQRADLPLPDRHLADRLRRLQEHGIPGRRRHAVAVALQSRAGAVLHTGGSQLLLQPQGDGSGGPARARLQPPTLRASHARLCLMYDCNL